MDCSPPGSSVKEILQTRILEWVAMPSSRGSSQPRDWTQVSHIEGRFSTIWATIYSHEGSIWILEWRLSLFQEIFLTQELNQGLLNCGWILYQLSYLYYYNWFPVHVSQPSMWKGLCNSVKLWAMPCMACLMYVHLGCKMDRSEWRLLKKHGSLEEERATCSCIHAVRTPWTIWKAKRYDIRRWAPRLESAQ